MRYINHFGEKSREYLQFRPTYPHELYQYLTKLAVEHHYAWDCGTGNGQAAVELATYFQQVIGTDVNQAQLEVAVKKSNIRYVCCAAEATQIENNTVNLISIAQALHWFNFDGFYREVRRVAKSDCIIAAWCYSLGSINKKIDTIIKKLYNEILGDEYWPPERRYIDNAYHTIPFPFAKIVSPYFTMEKEMQFSDLIGYLHTWSAIKAYQKKNQTNPVDLLEADLKTAWGDITHKHIMHWPLHLLVGKVK
ncbi:MAG: class I SAM-dependent methyltransferase [Gammaproteobacteria bacterium]|nr:class I SAM-dependent methyltransferase [Gammaproteobacteria bacterium]